MKIQQVIPTAYTSTTSHIRNNRNISFGDDCGPEYLSYRDMMKRLKNQRYVISGTNNYDAFGRLYDDVDRAMSTIESAEKASSLEREFPKYEIIRWNVSREDFAGLMSRFWEKFKSNINEVKSSTIDNYIENVEKIPKPGFWQGLFGPNEFHAKGKIIREVLDTFLKDGLHRLK